MEAIDSAKFRTKAKGELFGGFLFFGEEEYLKHNCLDIARKSVLGNDTSNTFNHIRLDADSYTPEALENAFLALPVFSDKKLVEIHSLPLDSFKDKEIEELVTTFSLLSDNPETVVILYTTTSEFNAGEMPKRPSKLFKTLSEVLCPVEFAKQSREKLSKWICTHFAHNKIICTSEMCRILFDTTGTDMYALSGEIEKLCAYVASCGRNTLTEADIALLATKNKEIGAFDFANAILSSDTDRAFYILSQYESTDKTGKEVNLTMGSIISIFRLLYRIALLASDGMGDGEIAKELKINEYRCSLYRRAIGRRSDEEIGNILSLCAEADKLLKSGVKNGYIVLSRLIIEAAR